MPDKYPPLRPKVARFVEEYLVDFKGGDAYQRAGYAPRGKQASTSASRLLSRPDVQAAVAAGQELISERTGLTQDWVRDRLRLEAEGKLDGSTATSRVAALSWLGKHYKMFVDRVEVDDVTQHSDQQLNERLAQLLAKTGVSTAIGGEGSS
ncbi:MAG: terminase small subunit [Devosiaceae bacterium]|nr:terminase small subunit [Devosiaceae bacterium]